MNTSLYVGTFGRPAEIDGAVVVYRDVQMGVPIFFLRDGRRLAADAAGYVYPAEAERWTPEAILAILLGLCEGS